MILGPHALKEAASAAKAEIISRIRDKQGGVATYFDYVLHEVLNRVIASESVHGWDISLPGPPRTEGAQIVAELRWLAAHLANRKEGRFLMYEARHRGDEVGRQSDIGDLEMWMSQGTTSCLTWKGNPLCKTVFDFAIIPMLLWELRPGTVFEIGSGSGTSASWLADIMGGFGLNSLVYSTDLRPVTGPNARVHFVTGDCRSPETLFEAEVLRSAPRPYLVIEDAHVNVHGVLLYIDEFLLKGDYLFIEDSRSKSDDLDSFLKERPHRYMVDTYYTDFFGRNATSATNSILVRV